MAQGDNKEINQLEQATEIQDADLFVLEQGGEAKKLEGETLKSYAEEAGINAIREIYPRTPASNDPDNSVFDVEMPDAGEAPMHSTVIKGKTVAVNQLCENGNFADASGWDTYSPAKSTIAVSGNVCTQTIIDNTGMNYNFMVRRPNNANGAVLGHKYFVSCDVLAPRAMAFVVTYSDNAVYSSTVVTANAWTTVAAIGTGAARTLSYFAVQPNNVGDIQIGDVYKYRNAKVIDLTDIFSAADLATIGTSVDTFKTLFLKKNGYPLPLYIPYDLGSLKNTDGKYSLHGRNIWDEQWENGVYSITVGSPLAKSANNNYIRSKNLIPALPNANYYYKGVSQYDALIQLDKNGTITRVNYGTISGHITVTTQAETCYFVFYAYGGTYMHNICLNLSDASFNDTYEKYYNGGTIDCSGKPLNGVGTAQDEEDFATGQRTTKSLIDDLIAMTWQPLGTNGRLYSDAISATVKNTASTALANIVAAKYPTVTASALAADDTLVGIAINGTNIVVRTPDGNNPTGEICYELAAPVVTTETPQPLETQYGYNVLEPVSGGVQSAEVDTIFYENIAGYIDKRLNGG